MPTLNWIGRKAVENHHKQMPFYLLKEEPSLSVRMGKKKNYRIIADRCLTSSSVDCILFLTSNVYFLAICPPIIVFFSRYHRILIEPGMYHAN